LPRIARATCLFALYHADGRLLCGGLGDGLIYLQSQQQNQPILERDAGFGNETLALGCPHKLDDWVLHQENLDKQAFQLLLATDGIADDLQPDKRSDFIQWLYQDFAYLAADKRRRMLQKELNNWPVPHHLDDKTLALLWQCEDENNG
ncbi:protein phosphatase 2C domain-containing protein, partial [Candidatus Venteria ishoeyi]